MTNEKILIVVLLVLGISLWIVNDHRSFFRRDMHNVGSDIRETGRDAADSIRKAVQ